MGEMAILDKTGDVRIIWDSDKPDEVAHARSTFDHWKSKGYLAYSVNKSGDKGEVLRSFDATAERMILAPRMVGG